MLGYAFLENSDDARNTPAVPFVLELERRGASFIIHDTLVKETEEGYKIEPDLSKSLKGCDALVLLTKHDEYKSLTPAKLQSLLKRKIIVDGRNLFDPEAFIKAGFVFKGVGKGNLNK